MSQQKHAWDEHVQCCPASGGERRPGPACVDFPESEEVKTVNCEQCEDPLNTTTTVKYVEVLKLNDIYRKVQ